MIKPAPPSTPETAARQGEDVSAVRAALRSLPRRQREVVSLGFYALALDGAKNPVRTLTSNVGHLLWSGIVPVERVGSLVTHLCGEQLFSGWGVRQTRYPAMATSAAAIVETNVKLTVE